MQLKHAELFSYRIHQKQPKQPRRKWNSSEQSRSFRTLTLPADTRAKGNRGCYYSDSATATERQRSDLFAICARFFSHVSSGSSTELIVLSRCTDWSTLFVRTCVGISMCWFRAILQRRIISQSTRIVAYERNRMQEGAIYLTRKAYKLFVVPSTRTRSSSTRLNLT